MPPTVSIGKIETFIPGYADMVSIRTLYSDLILPITSDNLPPATHFSHLTGTNNICLISLSSLQMIFCSATSKSPTRLYARLTDLGASIRYGVSIAITKTSHWAIRGTISDENSNFAGLANSPGTS